MRTGNKKRDFLNPLRTRLKRCHNQRSAVTYIIHLSELAEEVLANLSFGHHYLQSTETIR